MLFGIRHITTWNLLMKLQIIYVISYFNNQIYFLDMPFLIIHNAKKFRINVAAAGITYAYALVAYNRSWYIEVSILPIFPEIFDTSFNPFAFLLHLYFDTPRSIFWKLKSHKYFLLNKKTQNIDIYFSFQATLVL